MRLGIASNKIQIPEASPDEWAAQYAALGIGAVVFPLNCKAEDKSGKEAVLP